MKKVDLLIKGNLFADKVEGGGKLSLDVTTLADPSKYDLTNATIIEGDLDIVSLTCCGIVVCTGAVTSRKKGGCDGLR